jgi:hypothetical protein
VTPSARSDVGARPSGPAGSWKAIRLTIGEATLGIIKRQKLGGRSAVPSAPPVTMTTSLSIRFVEPSLLSEAIQERP